MRFKSSPSSKASLLLQGDNIKTAFEMEKGEMLLSKIVKVIFYHLSTKKILIS